MAELLQKRQIILVEFPFKDAEEKKRRPALIIGIKNNNIILAQITSIDKGGIIFDSKDLEKGYMNKPSYINSTNIITINKQQILGVCGCLNQKKFTQIIKEIREVIG